MRPKVLIAASSNTRARTLAKALAPLRLGVDVISGDERPKVWDSYRLLVCETGPKLPSVESLLLELPSKAHVVLLVSRFDVKNLPSHMRDPRVNHILRKPADQEQLQELRHVADKLATGDIFGLERYLPEGADLVYRRLHTFADRCNAVDELSTYAAKKRLRGLIRRTSAQVAEELLMNAMYHAPVNDQGECYFAHLSPQARVRRRTPRPVSLRYVACDKALYLSVRDRFGSFRREKLVHYLARCTTQEVQIENKKLGAGLGLYLVASSVTRMMVNLLPGGITEVICVFEPPPQPPGMRLFSFTAQRPKVGVAESESSAQDGGGGLGVDRGDGRQGSASGEVAVDAGGADVLADAGSEAPDDGQATETSRDDSPKTSGDDSPGKRAQAADPAEG